MGKGVQGLDSMKTYSKVGHKKIKLYFKSKSGFPSESLPSESPQEGDGSKLTQKLHSVRMENVNNDGVLGFSDDKIDLLRKRTLKVSIRNLDQEAWFTNF